MNLCVCAGNSQKLHSIIIGGTSSNIGIFTLALLSNISKDFKKIKKKIKENFNIFVVVYYAVF